MKLGESRNRALKPDAQAFDKIIVRTVPRFKDSELSGSEWRISASVELWRKGKLVHETSFRNVETAAQLMRFQEELSEFKRAFRRMAS